VKVSLGTRNINEAKMRQAAIAPYFEASWQSLRNDPEQLTHKQTVALSGEIYKTWVAALEDNPESSTIWQHVQSENDKTEWS